MIANLIANYKKQLEAANAVSAMTMNIISHYQKNGIELQNINPGITLAETFDNIVSKIIAQSGAEFWEVNEAMSVLEGA